MPIVLNPEAKKKVEFVCPVVELVARSEQKTVWKAEILFNLGLVFASLPDMQRAAFMKAKDLDSAFSWHHTPQGMNYWDKAHSLLSGEL